MSLCVCALCLCLYVHVYVYVCMQIFYALGPGGLTSAGCDAHPALKLRLNQHCYHTLTYIQYMHIHTYAYTYIHIHTHMHPLKNRVLCEFSVGALATRWRGTIPPDHLGCCLRRDSRMHTCTGGLLGAPGLTLPPHPTRDARGCQNGSERLRGSSKAE